ncbi:MAG: NTP transferase domain-containing protein [Thermoplasmata archaeon]|nr:NTP transferase domain-containing protein [Thermoplasmata archaeon]
MKAVLTLAGEGTRMLPWSRGLRKEFLPLYDQGQNGAPVLKPIAHRVLETLVGAGVTDVVLVVQPRDLAVVQNYFTIDREFLARHADHSDRLEETREFYRTLARLRLRFAVQAKPAGFGDAVRQAEPFVGAHAFLLHASDAVLNEEHRGRIPRAMAELREQDDLDAVLLVRRVRHPTRYGVVEGAPAGRFRGLRRLNVLGMEEKPARPKSNWAATAIYAFSPRLFDALRTLAGDRPSELEVTAGIDRILSEGGRVAAVVLDRPSDWRSVGSPDGYLSALRLTHRDARRAGNAHHRGRRSATH